VPANTTLFGISCNRQLSASELLVRPSDVTRSMVQKAVVVIASQPIFVRLVSSISIWPDADDQGPVRYVIGDVSLRCTDG
jgi:hypothetical protein